MKMFAGLRFRSYPSCRVTAAIVTLLMLAGLRLAQTDSETMNRDGGGMVSCGWESDLYFQKESVLASEILSLTDK